MKIATTIALIIGYTGVAVGQTEVPNTFQAGQPAKAAEVNANFDAIESAIDQLQGLSGVVWQGTWQNGVVYNRLDLVEYQGSTYIAVQGTNGSENPLNTNFWSLFASGGEQGLIGPKGPQGLIGPEGSQGPEGPQGSEGQQGPVGLPGVIGPEGSEGPQGPDGPAGSQGPEGPAGTVGPGSVG